MTPERYRHCFLRMECNSLPISLGVSTYGYGGGNGKILLYVAGCRQPPKRHGASPT